MGLGIEYLCDNTAAMTQQIQPYIEVLNNSTTTVPLSSLTFRYYFTKDSTPTTDLTCECDYAMLSCGTLTGCSVGASNFMTTTGTNADEYLEVGFSGTGSLSPGASTGPMQLRIHPTDYQYMFNQTNDYSFDPTKTTFAPSTTVTLYQNGTLVWGTEP